MGASVSLLALTMSLAFLYRTFWRVRSRRPPAPRDDPPNPNLHPCIGTHEVFISHRGLEMKRGFANHLYHTLKHRGINAFLDMAELPEGQDVRLFMLEAARRAIIQVPIFTENYAASSWCLDELVEMMKSTTSSSNAKILPVFYNVNPEELTLKRDGPFVKAINAHRRNRTRNEDKIREWEDALQRASWLQGLRLDDYNRCEGKLVQVLVAMIEKEMQHRSEEDVCDSVGLEKRVDDVLELLHLEEKSNVYFVLLWGMGGIGKTTLARSIYKRLGHVNEFQAKSIVENCGVKTATQIQSELLYGLLRQENANEVREGKQRLKLGLREKVVLIILDDVQTYDSITAVIDPTSLHPGSRILVTSRDRTVLRHKNNLSDIFKGELYEVPGMDSHESLRLFCLHAFEKPDPAPGLEGLAENISNACSGLPLALKVLGDHLRMRTDQKELWDEAIEMLSSNAHEGISENLRISYNALNKHQKEMFLDVACFLVGKHRRAAEYFWHGLVEYWKTGLERLVELCLVKMDEDESFWAGGMHKHKRLTMHDHLRYLGRGIVKEESENSGKWTRLWNDTDWLQVSKSNQCLDQIRGLAAISLPSLDSGLLSQMSSLRLLFLKNTRVVGDVDRLQGLQIKWLDLGGETPPQELLSEFLTVLELDVEIPDATNKIELPFSCGELKNLRKLDINGCGGLKGLPDDFGSLKSLEELVVHDSAIYKLPSSFGQLTKLQKLDMCRCKELMELPEDFGSLKCLEELRVCGLGITTLPSSFCQLEKLRKLDMEGCIGLKELPEDFGSLNNLEELRIRGLGITKLPNSFSKLFLKLKKLKKLDMDEYLNSPKG